jgi:acyl dehydratase
VQYFEDIAEGEVARFGRYEVTREAVLAFARSFDAQPFHISDAAAAETHFGRLSASGWHTCAMAMAMFVEKLTEDGQAGLGSPGVDELKWLKPVYPGDTLTLEREVLETRRFKSKPDMGLVRNRLTVFNQDAVPVMSMVLNSLVKTRPAQ